MTQTTPDTDWVAGTWTIDPAHSEVAFTVRHLVGKVRGKFDTFEGKVVTGDSIEQTKAEATIDLGSVNTGDEGRDGHLKSGDFFDVETHGHMTFTTTSFDGEKATGDLTIKGVTKPVQLDVEYNGIGGDPWGGTRIGFEATTSITRQDFNVNFNGIVDGSKVLVGDKITIVLSIEAVLEQG